MTVAEKQDAFFSWMTGIVAQVVGVIVTESIVSGLILAFAGGFVGYLGKELAARVAKKVFGKSEQKTEK